MRKLFWSIIIGVCSIACSCADDLPEEFDTPVKAIVNDSITVEVKTDTIMNDSIQYYLFMLNEETWRFLKDNKLFTGGWKVRPININDIIDFLTWVTDYYTDDESHVTESCWFDERVARYLGYKVEKKDGYWSYWKHE